MEERGPEHDLMSEGSDRLLEYGWVVVEHGFKGRPNNLRYQHVVFSVCALHPEMVQESEDVARSGVRP